MVRPPCFDSNGMKKGAWSEDEDNKLRAYVSRYGHWNWRLLPKFAGLARCGKSCRLRWMNYLKPGVKKGNFTKEEEELIVKLHARLGNKWSAMATQLPGRTDNEIKNFYHTRIDRRRKRNPSSRKVKQPAMEASREAAATMEASREAAATSLNKPAEASDVSIPTAQSQQDLWSAIFDADIDYTEAPLIEDDFVFANLSSSDSSYMSAIADDGNGVVSSESAAPPSLPESLWSGASAMNHGSEINLALEEGGLCDPLVQWFDYGMDIWFR